MSDLIDKILDKAWAGDATYGVKTIESLQESQRHEIFNDPNIKCFYQRFTRTRFEPEISADVTDEFMRSLIAIYQEYWWNALLKKDLLENLENTLTMRLREHFNENPLVAHDEQVYNEKMIQLLNDKKHNGLFGGRTKPLLECMVWLKEDEQKMKVSVIDQVEHINVNFIQDCISRGWMHYASGNKKGVGGWATQEKIFCVRASYDDLEDERFQVSYLKHEAQHFRDYKEFPWLVQIDLEFRAKLTELAFCNQTKENLLNRFTISEPHDLSTPHAVANKVLTMKLLERLGSTNIKNLYELPIEQLNGHARALFHEHTQILESTGAKEKKIQPVAQLFKELKGHK